MIIYLSGPMSGFLDRNFPTFNKWAKHFRDRGEQVINPAENDGGSIDKSWSYYMELDINSLLICEAVVLLPGWELSTGSRLEIAIAQAIGRKIYLVEDFAKSKFPVPLVLRVKVIVEK